MKFNISGMTPKQVVEQHGVDAGWLRRVSRYPLVDGKYAEGTQINWDPGRDDFKATGATVTQGDVAALKGRGGDQVQAPRAQHALAVAQSFDDHMVDVGGLTPAQAIEQFGLDADLVRRASRYPLNADGTYAQGMKFNVQSLSADPAVRAQVKPMPAEQAGMRGGPKLRGSNPLDNLDLSGMTQDEARALGVDVDRMKQAARQPLFDADGRFVKGQRAFMPAMPRADDPRVQDGMADVAGLKPEEAIQRFGLDADKAKRVMRYPLEDGLFPAGMKLNVVSLAKSD